MLLFVFPGVLLRFAVNAPALDVLFQLPPRRKARRVLTDLPLLVSYTFTLDLSYPTGKHAPNFIEFFGAQCVLFDTNKTGVFGQSHHDA